MLKTHIGRKLLCGLLALVILLPAGGVLAFHNQGFTFQQLPVSFNDTFSQERQVFEVQFNNNRTQFDNQFSANKKRFEVEFNSRFNQNIFDFDNDFLNPYPESPDSSNYEVPSSCPVSISALESIENFPPDNGPIVAFGDSLTAGVGAANGEGYVDELSDLLNRNIINSGVSGDTTRSALNRLQRDVLSYNPSTVIVWLGGNDILQRYYLEVIDRAEALGIEDELNELVLDVFGTIPNTNGVVSRAETFQNLETIIRRIQDSGAVVALVGFDGEILNRNFNNQLRQIASITDSLFISDVLDGVLGTPSLTSDLVHPNERGYDIVANRMFPRVSCVQVSS